MSWIANRRTFLLGFTLTCMFVCPVRGHGTSHGSHHTPDGNAKMNRLSEPDVIHDKEHIKEHYEGTVEFNEKDMSDEELEFHYFNLHDVDNNTKLDGLEILQALTHMFGEEDQDAGETTGKTHEQYLHDQEEKQKKQMDDMIRIIDRVLKEDDYNQDGYITYIEFQLARRRDEVKRKMEEKENEQKAKV